MKILLVEDDAETASYVAAGLREYGHVVDHAATGPGGLQLATGGQPHDVLIIDRMLPGLDGLAIVKAVRSAGLRAPILLLTTMDGIDDRVEGLESGADDYLIKPFAFAEFGSSRRVPRWLAPRPSVNCPHRYNAGSVAIVPAQPLLNSRRESAACAPTRAMKSPYDTEDRL